MTKLDKRVSFISQNRCHLFFLCACVGRQGSLFLLDQFLGLEIFPEVEDLPGGQAEQAAHREDGEVEDPGVGRLVGVSHLFLALPHVREVLQ